MTDHQPTTLRAMAEYLRWADWRNHPAAKAAAATPDAVHANVIQIRDTIARRPR